NRNNQENVIGLRIINTEGDPCPLVGMCWYDFLCDVDNKKNTRLSMSWALLRPGRVWKAIVSFCELVTQKEAAERLREVTWNLNRYVQGSGAGVILTNAACPLHEDLWAMDVGKTSPVGDKSLGWKKGRV
ncbi:jg23729, partial [Pararge aegeria aegeria]